MLRSAPQERVSKHGHEHHVCCPSFETRRVAALLRMRPVGRFETERAKRLAGSDRFIVSD